MKPAELPEDIRRTMDRVIADINIWLMPGYGLEASLDLTPLAPAGAERYAGTYLGIIGPEHRREPWMEHNGRRHQLGPVMGHVTERDYGKMVFLQVSDVVTVENDGQRDRRQRDLSRATWTEQIAAYETPEDRAEWELAENAIAKARLVPSVHEAEVRRAIRADRHAAERAELEERQARECAELEAILGPEH